MGTYCVCALSWPLPELSIHGAGQKDRSSGDESYFPNVAVKFWPMCMRESKILYNLQQKLAQNLAKL